MPDVENQALRVIVTILAYEMVGAGLLDKNEFREKLEIISENIRAQAKGRSDFSANSVREIADYIAAFSGQFKAPHGPNLTLLDGGKE